MNVLGPGRREFHNVTYATDVALIGSLARLPHS